MCLFSLTFSDYLLCDSFGNLGRDYHKLSVGIHTEYASAATFGTPTDAVRLIIIP